MLKLSLEKKFCKNHIGIKVSMGDLINVTWF